MSNISKPSTSGSKPAASAQGAAAGGKLVIPGYIQRKGALRRQDAVERWQKIEHAIHQIYEQNASSLSFQNLYTCAYQIVLHKYGEVLYSGVKSTLKKYIEGVREAIMKKTDEVFLEELLAQWNKHRTAVSMVRDILMYMDRNYVPQNKQLPVFDLGIKLFGQEVFHKQTLDRIQRLIMDIIRKDRDGEVIADRFLLKNLTQMMLEISKKEIYQPCFEQKFLEESKEFFTREAAMFFEKSTAPDYLQKVTQRLREERERAIRCLDSETKPKIEDVLKNVMIDAYKFRIIEKEGSGCTVMLQDWRLDDLKLVYEVLSLVPGALQPCIDLVQNFARAQGYQIVTDKDKEEKPTEMIQECINLRERYEELLNHSFSEKKHGKIQKNAEFQNSAKKAFDDIVNKNERFPEYLSLYVDSKMKKGKTQTAETQFEQLFEQVIALFRHLREKDLFEKYYKSHLARRLLAQRSQSDEAEKGFIARLKAEFGYQFTTKLEGMFQDMRISAESMENFKNHINFGSIQCPIDLSVTVLTTGYWPVTQAVNIAVPDIVTQASNVFKDFYMNAHSGRRLTWQLNMGTADIRANGFDKKYELNVSTFQMCILLLFNEQNTYSYGELLQLTKMPAADLKRNLLALAVKSEQHDKVLEKDKGKTLDNETKFTANNAFKSKLIKVKITPVVIKETTEQVQETMTKVDEERKWQLDAAIVRIMKARKQAEHRELVLEVTKQLQQRFMPSPELIKKRIESLIEREYLERSKESRSKYFYVA